MRNVKNVRKSDQTASRLASQGVDGFLNPLVVVLAAVPGVRGVMLTFDDFIIGMEQFGTRILPLMRCRGGVRRAA
jgi:hypothetical protein